MAVLAAFKDGWTALRANPALLVAGAFIALGGQLSVLWGIVDSSVAPLVWLGWLLVFPFVVGGFIGMALEAIRESETSLERFVRSGRTHYVRLLLATILYGAVVFGFVVVAMLLSMAGSVVTFVLAMVASTAVPPEVVMVATFVVIIAGVLLAVVAVLALLVAVQFYTAAIVVEDKGVVPSFRRSIGVVRRNLPSVIGFSILWAIALDVFLTPELTLVSALSEYGLTELLAMEPEIGQGVSIALSVVVATVGAAYFYTVYTAYYVRLLPKPADSDDADQPPDADPSPAD
ncbi:DUF7847 domain-containing protein [Natrialba swarupiae]|uniref:DUF7847 domain-containing protein n=1 Tax=Natrialba swarupiae TaxID=2448032 RepID=A0A5D5AP31_9EURY|nr:hypothetical protein [Natrialba swarupiae]TYT62804.1 hypothetical protein FYC77_07160 [Natrialba swarupiae]